MTSLLDSSWSPKPAVALRACSPQSLCSHPSTASTLSIGDQHFHHTPVPHRHHPRKKKKPKKRPLTSAQWRSIALEKTYVHDVYSILASKNILLNQNSGQNSGSQNAEVHKRVRSFLEHQVEFGSMILDLGCGDSDYSSPNDPFVMIGLDRCSGWLHNSSVKSQLPVRGQLIGDCLRLPFKDAFFDAILCINVLHHLSTVRRRIAALKQITRCLKIGGKVLFTVRGPSPKFMNLESRDLLIRVNNFHAENDNSDSDSDDSSYDDSDPECDVQTGIPGSHRSLRYCNSSRPNTTGSFMSPSSTDLDNCYAFIKRALKRISMTKNVYAQKSDSQFTNSVINYQNPMYSNHDSEEQSFAIELRNLDPEADMLMHTSGSVDCSPLESFSSSISGPTTSSSGFFSASFLSNIREHFITWRSQFVNNSVWHSLDAKLAALNETQIFNPDSTNHRFSLPMNFLSKPESAPNNNNKNILQARNKIHASSTDRPPIVHFYPGEQRSLKLNLPESITSRLSMYEENNSNHNGNNTFDAHHRLHLTDKIAADKNSEFSRLSSTPTWARNYGYHYSLPDIQAELYAGANNNNNNPCYRSMPSLITDPRSQNRKLSWFDDCFLGSLAEEETILLDNQHSLCSNFTELDENIASLPGSGCGGVGNGSKKPPADRKLSRQRSFSADYQVPEIGSYEAPPRRFSASPNIGTHRYNNNCHTPHAQQISVDSEESFITIIPANRSARPSITDLNTTFENLTDFDEEEELELSENDAEELLSSSDENDDDAYCESLSEGTSGDETSISSGLELTVKSLITNNNNNNTNNNHQSNSNSNNINNRINNNDYHLEGNDSGDVTELSTDSSELDDEYDEDDKFDEEVTSGRHLFDDNATPPSILHHYYHVFCSDELENIIRNHITDLDLLETTFEPETGTWFVVAEKICVWTI